MTIVISVVVPTFNRPDLLRRCLDALLARPCQRPAGAGAVWPPVEPGPDGLAYAWLKPECTPGVTYAGPLAEAVLTSPREKLLEEPAGRRPHLRYVPVLGPHGPAVARNRGWQAARGSIIAFTDDDCVPQPDWLKAGQAAFSQEVLGVMGRLVVPLSPQPTDYERNMAGLEISKFVTANCFYRRNALREAGGFDERFRMAWREDSDLFFTMLKMAQRRGQSLVCAPGALVIHPVRSAPWGISLSQQRKSMFNALLYKKHPRLYRHYIQPLPPWRYYLSVVTLLLALASIGPGTVEVALAAAGLWLFLTGWFCGQRLRRTVRTPTHVAEMVVTSVLIPPLSIFWRIVGALKFRVFFL